MPFRLKNRTAYNGCLSNNAGQRNDRADRARLRAVGAAARPHRPPAVHCSSGGLAQPAHIHSGTWALRTGPVHIRSRTCVLRMGLVHIRSRTWVLRTGLVHIRSRTWLLRTGRIHIHRHRGVLRTRPYHTHGHSRALRTRLLHWSAPPASRRPARLQHQCRRRRALHKRTAPQRSQCASMTMLLLLQQEQVVGRSF
jgi:hypothetical protein